VFDLQREEVGMRPLTPDELRVMTPENPADGSLHYVYRAERG